MIPLMEHDLRANASRLSRGKTGSHPRIKSEGVLLRMMLVAFAAGCGIASRTGGALRRSATGSDSAFRAGLRVGAGLFSGRARLRIKLLVAAARRPALHIAPALRTAADVGVG